MQAELFRENYRQIQPDIEPSNDTHNDRENDSARPLLEKYPDKKYKMTGITVRGTFLLKLDRYLCPPG